MKLDLGGGAGYKMPPDFHIVDISGGNTTWDLRNVPLPFDDGSVELIHCSHTLEHITKAEAKNLLRDCYRMLVPGGIITLCVPDMDIFIDCHLSGDWSAHPDHLHRDLNYCAAGDEFPGDHPWRHKYMWCWESLAYVLEALGYVQIERHSHSDGRHAHLFPGAYNPDYATCSLYVDAVKPE
jgi:SAM-dependent methyltransferase